MARTMKFLTPRDGNRGRDAQVAAMAAREARHDSAVDDTVEMTRGFIDAEGVRIEKLASELGLEPFRDELQALDSRFAHAEEVVRARMAIIGLERHLAGVSTTGGSIVQPLSAQKRKDLESQLASLKAKVDEPTGPAPMPEGELPEIVRRALQVVEQGLAPARRMAPEKQRMELQAALDDIEEARHALGELIEDRRKQMSYEACLKAKNAHDGLLVELYRTAQEFAAVAARETTFRMAFPNLGLTARSDILPNPGPLMQTILVLGSAADYGSALAEFGRWLTSRELLK